MKGGTGSPTGVENLHKFLEVDEQIRAQILVLQQNRQALLQEQQRIRDEEAVLQQRLDQLRAQDAVRIRRAAEERSRRELANLKRNKKKSKSNKNKSKNNNNKSKKSK